MKNVILLSIASVLLLGAGAIYFWQSKSSDYPDTPESVTSWRCEVCLARTDLTARQHHEWMNSDRLRRDEAIQIGVPVFLCDACKQFTVVRVLRCPRHEEWFAPMSSTGKETDCPKCLQGQ